MLETSLVLYTGRDEKSEMPSSSHMLRHTNGFRAFAGSHSNSRLAPRAIHISGTSPTLIIMTDTRTQVIVAVMERAASAQMPVQLACRVLFFGQTAGRTQ